MPNLVNIVLADALATPVNHTFIPLGADDKGIQWLVDQSQSNAVGYWRISLQTTAPLPPKAGESSDGRTFRVRVGLHEPVLETNGDSSMSGILPAPTVAYIPRAFTEYVIPERASLQNRKDLWKMAGNLIDNVQIQAAVEQLVRYT
jgi:hypothetical protein